MSAIEEGPADPFLRGFTTFDVSVEAGLRIHGARAGAGPAVLLLHGHPQTHVTWHHVAPLLVDAGFSVIATDLRGYGDSSRPSGGVNHVNYSKRIMARDQVAVMRALGYESFSVVGHDRGGRVAHRLALDHPDKVHRLALLDIAPTATMYERTNRQFATKYFWWFFLIQPAPFPERMIEANVEFYLRQHLSGQSRTAGVPTEVIFEEYLRCYRVPGTVHAICEDYRASAGIDLEHDAADSVRRIEAPTLALWGAHGVVGSLYDVLETWRERAIDVQGRALPCGHALQEEAPDQTSLALLEFLDR